MKTTIYANYGMLGAEKRTVYTTSPSSEIYDELVIDIPDDLYAGINDLGDRLISTGYADYLLSEVLCGNDKPYIRYFDGGHMVVRELEVRA